MAAHEPEPGPTGTETGGREQLEELLFQCLEARSQGDADLLARLLSAHADHAHELRQLLGVVDGMDRERPLPQLGEYELLHAIGGGGMGVVYLARQRRLQRLVAIKLIRPELLGSGKMRERFQREARAQARVAHPGICPIYDFGEIDGQPYLVMQFLTGKRLSELPRPQDRQELDRLLELFEQICEAVQVAHQAGLVHRDLKPPNVVLSAGGRPVILDFGLARMVSGEAADQPLLTTQSQPVGTPAYMAPERLTGAATAMGPGVDVYSLGVSLYQLLAGELPFQSPVLEALWSKILRGELPVQPLRRRWIPRELEIIVRTAMERDPARRYDSAKSLGEDLRRLRLGLPILARRPSTVTRVVRWTQRNRVVAWLLVGLTAALAGAGVLVLNLTFERAHNRSLALAGAAAGQGAKNPALQTRLALEGILNKDWHTARSELAQGLADWQLRERLFGADEVCDMAVPLTGGMAALVAQRRVVASRDVGGRRVFERPDGGPCTSFAVAPDEHQLALGGGDGKLWLFDLRRGGQPEAVEVGADAITLLRYSPDHVGGWLAIGTDKKEEGSRARTAHVHLLECASRKLRVLESCTDLDLLILQFEFTRDSKQLLAVVQGKFVSVFQVDGSSPAVRLGVDKKALVIALVRNDSAIACGCRYGELFEVALAGGTTAKIGTHDKAVVALVLSPDGHTLASASDDRTAKLWDLAGDAEPRQPITLRHPVTLTNVAFRADGKLLATGANDMSVRLWTLQGDNVLELRGNIGATHLLRLGQEEVWLASEANGGGVYDLQAHGRELLLGHSAITAMAPSRKAPWLWTGSADGTVEQWSGPGVAPVVPPRADAVVALGLSPDEALLLSVEERGHAVVRNLVSDTERRLPLEFGMLVTGWILEGGRTVCLQTKGPLAKGNALTRFRRTPGSDTFARDGTPQLLPSGLSAGSYDPVADRILLGLPKGGFLAVDPAGVAPAVTTPGKPCARVLRSPTGAPYATCTTSDVSLWRSGHEQVLATDSSRTEDLQFSPDGQHLGAISHSGAVWLFATGDGHLVWHGQVPAIGWSVAFTPDGRYLLTGDSDGVVRHWLVAPADQLDLARQKLQAWRWNAEELRILEASGVSPSAW